MGENIIEIAGLRKSFDHVEVVKGVDMQVHQGEFLTLLGPSGCGKTTTLRMIAGFEEADSGHITIDGQEVTALPPYKRAVNTVFQSYALFPLMNVYDNVAYGLTVKRLPKAEIREKVTQALRTVQLEGFEKRRVSQMSGGQCQRVAIARALVNGPKVLLLDEPLGALDLKLRKQMQLELKRLQKQLGITFIYVTHDQEEAMTMSDRIAVMCAGEIQQIGTPSEIYNAPATRFVADFIGESNILDGVMLRDFRVEFAGQEFTCVDAGFGSREIVQVVVRPEDIQVVPAIQGQLTGLVENVIFKGVHYEMHVRQAGYEWIIHSTQASQVGELIGMNIGPDEIHIMHRTQG